GGFRADVRLVAIPRVHRPAELVRAALRDRIDVGADEVALTNIVWRDAYLHLLDRLERNRRDARAIAGLPRRRVEAERAVEVGAVDRDVVRAVVLTGECALSAVLRRHPDDVREPTGNRGQICNIVV